MNQVNEVGDLFLDFSLVYFVILIYYIGTVFPQMKEGVYIILYHI